MFIPFAPDLEYLNLILARVFSYERRIAGAPENPRRRNSDRETAKNTDTPQCPPGSTLAPPTTSRKTTPSASTMPGAPSPATAPKTTRFTRATGCARTRRCILAEGLLMGTIIECPKHNGRFDVRSGAAKGAPVCVNVTTYPVKVEGGRIWLQI